MSDITSELLQKWTDAVKGGDAKQVTELYHRNAILLGTFSNKERVGHELILEYFENLLKSPVEVRLYQSTHLLNLLTVLSTLVITTL